MFRLVLQSNGQPSTSIPVSHTCFDTLDLPTTYESETVLREKLLIALENNEGFGLI